MNIVTTNESSDGAQYRLCWWPNTCGQLLQNT